LPRKRSSPDSSARFRRTRAAHRDETAEDYVEAILQIARERGEARVRDLATFMGVSHVTVTRIISRLADEGLVATDPYKPVSLTPAGRRLATRVRQRHQTVLRFLHALGVPARQAEIDAEGIEHHVSDATIKAMRRAMEGGSVQTQQPQGKPE
jgi:DtxR family transcriptional regulator, manganese transport regulator